MNIKVELADSLANQRKRALLSRLNDCAVYESIGSRTILSCETGYKIGFYYPVLDAFLSELNKHFSKNNVALIKAINACSPCSDSFLD